MKQWTNMGWLNVERLKIGDTEVTELGGENKLPPISPLRSNASTETQINKINEIIAALKVAGLMQEK